MKTYLAIYKVNAPALAKAEVARFFEAGDTIEATNQALDAQEDNEKLHEVRELNDA